MLHCTPLRLSNGCFTGKISVFPANWDTPSADLSRDWYIHYRFHHPHGKQLFPRGYLVIVKGMNDVKDRPGRQRLTRDIMRGEIEDLKKGYCPIPARYGISVADELEISPYTGFADAMKAAFKLLKANATTKRMTNALPHIYRAAEQLNQHQLAVQDIRQKHLEILLLKVSRNKAQEQGKEWGPEAYNHYRAYLQMLFKQLKKVGATEVKPVDDIEKRKGIKKARVGLASADFRKIDRLKETDYAFWRLIQVFFRSGARETEMMAMTTEHVDLPNNRFKVLVKKGRGGWEWVWKTIAYDVRYLWEEIMSEAVDGQFLFSKNLRPGSTPIKARNLTVRWRRKGKKDLGIAADFYEFKHQYTTQVIDVALRKIESASQVAAKNNNHKGTKMVKSVYDLKAGERLHDELVKGA